MAEGYEQRERDGKGFPLPLRVGSRTKLYPSQKMILTFEMERSGAF